MSRAVAFIYGIGVVGASALTFGAAAVVAAGLGPRSMSDAVILLGFSGLPIGALLILAVRWEWTQRDVSGLGFFFIVTAVSLLILIGVFAHAENATFVLASAEIATCLAGCFMLSRQHDTRRRS